MTCSTQSLSNQSLAMGQRRLLICFLCKKNTVGRITRNEIACRECNLFPLE